MPVHAAKLKSLIESELESVLDDRVVRHVRALLVEPHEVMRGWDYGQPKDQFPCWTVLDDHKNSRTGIAYCEFGFGPRSPWGLVSTGDGKGEEMSIGMDSGWFESFMDAFFDSFAVTTLPIWRVFSMDGGAPKEPLTAELSWEDAWVRCKAVREDDPRANYMVHHTVSYAG